MAEGRLGVSTTIVGDVDVYTVPNGKTATVNVILCHNGVDAVVKIFARDGVKVDEDLILPSVFITASSNARLEMTAVTLSAGETITVESTDSDVICRVHGYEESEVI